MADTGKIVTKGLHAGAIKYVVTKGLVPNPSSSTLIACFITKGLGIQSRRRPVLHGMATNPASGSTGGQSLFGGYVITGWLEYTI